MRKKFFMILLTLICFLCCVSVLSACGGNDNKSGTSKRLPSANGLKYELNDDGKSCSVVGISTNTATDIVIPNTHKDLAVTSIKSWAFDSCSSLISVTIPESVTSIEKYAFYNCHSLKIINIDYNNAVYSSQGGIIYNKDKTEIVGAAGGIPSIIIPDHVTKIAMGAFAGCSLSNVVIPESVTSIGDYAFYDCRSLTNITIPESITSIAPWTFSGCTSLISVTIGKGVTSIGNSAFGDCYKLVEVYNLSDFKINKGSSDNGKLGYYALDVYTDVATPSKLSTDSDGLVIHTDGENKIAVAHIGDSDKIIVPDGTISINDYAFYDCNSLTSITIPDSIKSIGYRAFKGCDNISFAKIPGLVIEHITKNKLQILEITNGEIGDRAFKGCNLLTSLTIGKDVKSIGESAFSSCDLLTSIIIGNGVTSIGNFAFDDCNNITDAKIPGLVIDYIYKNKLQTLEITNGKIGDRAFSGCTSLTSVIIGKDVISIGNSAFSGCDLLASITMPESIKSIGDHAFYACDSVTSVIIPNDVASIGEDAFAYCSTLETVYWNATKCATVGSFAFTGCNKLNNIVISDNIQFIPSKAFEECSSLEYNVYGNAKYLGNENNPYVALIEATSADITSCEINAQTKVVADKAFNSCSSLKSVTIGDSVTFIGKDAFTGCSSLEYNVYGNAKYLGNENNPYLVLIDAASADITSCEINAQTKVVADKAFNNCSSLKVAYYLGTKEQWNAIIIGSSNDNLKKATRYYYSETEPADKNEKYWHYVDGAPTAW